MLRNTDQVGGRAFVNYAVYSGNAQPSFYGLHMAKETYNWDPKIFSSIKTI